MIRNQILFLATTMASILLLQAGAMAESRRPALDAASETCRCDLGERNTCESRITTANGEDGKDNSGPDRGNGGKGGTIRNADKCSSSASANGGKGRTISF